MKKYQIEAGQGFDGLQLSELSSSSLAADEVRVHVRAVSLNFRDLLVAWGKYPGIRSGAFVPCSDGAGEVVEVGSAVREFSVGDRVMASFFPNWFSGPPSRAKIEGALGAERDGMLAQEVVLPGKSWVRVPHHLSYEEAATIPCVGTTAWNALFGGLRTTEPKQVLLLGTGGVSVMGLQLAQAAGWKTFITSSSDDKLKKARSHGAHKTINYAKYPDWEEQVKESAGEGVDLVLEVGGAKTLPKSMASTRMGGEIVIIGGVTGFAREGISPGRLLFDAMCVRGVFVGSRDMLQEVCAFIEEKQIHPVVHKTFAFEEAPDAYRYVQSGQHFGKVVIKVSG
ncbi:MAG: NAD(P)-dependent alcohol dehydrogenase [Myxococcales bacterium]|nr:NAD(P)-dependent alcohol dehydrogenase [Myxococcales bacterium]